MLCELQFTSPNKVSLSKLNFITHLIDDENRRAQIAVKRSVSVPFQRIYVFLEPIIFALFLFTEILKCFFIQTRNCVQLVRPCFQGLHC